LLAKCQSEGQDITHIQSPTVEHWAVFHPQDLGIIVLYFKEFTLITGSKSPARAKILVL